MYKYILEAFRDTALGTDLNQRLTINIQRASITGLHQNMASKQICGVPLAT